MTIHDKLSRRSFFRGAAAATSVGVVSACGGTNAPAGPDPDIIPLNAMLAAEYQAIAAYNAGLSILSAPPSGDPQAANALTLAAIATQWKTQHTAHAALLASTITGIGGTPVVQSTVTFTPPTGFTPSVTNVLKLAANLEKGAAIAYATAVANLSTAGNRFVAGTIEGDETQHFIVLYALLNGVVSPGVALAAMGTANVVPRTFVTSPTSDTSVGLDGLMAFTYA